MQASRVWATHHRHKQQHWTSERVAAAAASSTGHVRSTAQQPSQPFNEITVIRNAPLLNIVFHTISNLQLNCRLVT